MSITCVVETATVNTVKLYSNLSADHNANTPTSQQITLKTQRKYTKSEIYHIAFLLRHKLVPDLIHPIIQHAQLYENISTTSNAYMVVRVNNSPRTCITTPQIASNTSTRTPIRSVKFSITSKDQGYVAYPGSGSWTWFTAGIIKPGCGEIYNEREVLNNVTTSNGFITQHVTWSADSENQEEADWVRGLQYGDAVAVMAHAKYLGWVNTIVSAQVTISQAVIVR